MVEEYLNKTLVWMNWYKGYPRGGEISISLSLYKTLLLGEYLQLVVFLSEVLVQSLDLEDVK